MNKSELFKKISIAEAISFLLLLGIAMPLKYMFEIPLAVKYVGWIHGLLFMAYVVSLFLIAHHESWSLKKIILGLVASVLPFGPFAFHKYASK